jgi:hypothetical protein
LGVVVAPTAVTVEVVLEERYLVEHRWVVAVVVGLGIPTANLLLGSSKTWI